MHHQNTFAYGTGTVKGPVVVVVVVATAALPSTTREEVTHLGTRPLLYAGNPRKETKSYAILPLGAVVVVGGGDGLYQSR